jgi:DNA-binding transcriptional ArsR family regulator
LKLIEGRSRTFGELLKGTPEFHLSRPILSGHLRALQEEGLLRRRVNGRRIEYELTRKGNDQEQLRKESIAGTIEIMKLLVSEPSASKTLHDLSELAKQDPALAELFIKELSILMAKDEVLQWIQKHPGREGARVVKQELAKRMRKPERLEDLGDAEKVKVTFETLLEAIRDTTKPKESRKGQDR